jgi:Zn finger protein HypA/HybF involved in hydrogenase expression
LRIRTRYKLFRIILVLSIITFILSLYDIFANASAWFIPVMIVYIVLAIFALILYIGHKPQLDEEILAAPEPMPPQDVAAEVARGVNVQGPHHFRCPFCANIFALELTHLRKEHELRMDCPFCSNTIRIPRRPKLAAGQPVRLDLATPDEQALFTCENCGEVLRYTAPGQHPTDHVRVHTCPHCGSERVDPARGTPA